MSEERTDGRTMIPTTIWSWTIPKTGISRCGEVRPGWVARQGNSYTEARL